MKPKDVYKVGEVLYAVEKCYNYREQKEYNKIAEVTVSKVGTRYVYVATSGKNYTSYTRKTEIYNNCSGINILSDEDVLFFKFMDDYAAYQEWKKLSRWFLKTRYSCPYSLEQLREVKKILEPDGSEERK